MNKKKEDRAGLQGGEEWDRQIYEALIEMGWLIPQTEEGVRLAEEAMEESECPPLPPALADPSRLFHLLDENLEEGNESSSVAAESSKADAASNFTHVLAFSPGSPANSDVAEPYPVPPFLGLLREVTGETPSVIARELDVTVPFLTLIVQHRDSVPGSWRTEMIERAAVRWSVDRRRVRRSLEHPAQQEIAASRSAPYSTERISCREILKRSGLKPEAQKYWLALAEAE